MIPEAGPVAQGLLDRGEHRRVGVPENHRSPRADVIDVGVAVCVPDPAAAGALQEQRISANGTPRPHRAVDAAWYQLGGPLEKPLGQVACGGHACNGSGGGYHRRRGQSSNAPDRRILLRPPVKPVKASTLWSRPGVDPSAPRAPEANSSMAHGL